MAENDFLAAADGLISFYVETGEREEAVRVWDRLLSTAEEQYVSKADLALAARPLDEDLAFELLGEAFEERDPKLINNLLGVFVELGYGEDPRFREILRRMGLDLVGYRFVELEEGD